MKLWTASRPGWPAIGLVGEPLSLSECSTMRLKRNASGGGSGEVVRRLAAGDAFDIGKAGVDDARPDLDGGAGVVRREEDIVQLEKWRIGRRRLRVEDVEAGAGERATLQSDQERWLIDDRAAA